MAWPMPQMTPPMICDREVFGFKILPAAVTATKSLDDKKMGEWLRKNRVDTIIGQLHFDGPNNYGEDLFKVKQVQDGKWVVVWPKEFAAPGARLLPP